MKCSLCGDPPATIGEAVLCQTGPEDYLCLTCHKLHPPKGKGFKFIPAETQHGKSEEEQISVDSATAKRIRYLARESDRNIASVVRDMLKTYEMIDIKGKENPFLFGGKER
jgi:hypothetical protein